MHPMDEPVTEHRAWGEERRKEQRWQQSGLGGCSGTLRGARPETGWHQGYGGAKDEPEACLKGQITGHGCWSSSSRAKKKDKQRTKS